MLRTSVHKGPRMLVAAAVLFPLHDARQPERCESRLRQPWHRPCTDAAHACGKGHHVPDIADLGSRLAAVQQDVGGLEVGVDDIVRMQEVDSLQQNHEAQQLSTLLHCPAMLR